MFLERAIDETTNYLLVSADEVPQLLLLVFQRGVQLLHLIEHIEFLGF